MGGRAPLPHLHPPPICVLSRKGLGDDGPKESEAAVWRPPALRPQRSKARAKEDSSSAGRCIPGAGLVHLLSTVVLVTTILLGLVVVLKVLVPILRVVLASLTWRAAGRDEFPDSLSTTALHKRGLGEQVGKDEHRSGRPGHCVHRSGSHHLAATGRRSGGAVILAAGATGVGTMAY